MHANSSFKPALFKSSFVTGRVVFSINSSQKWYWVLMTAMIFILWEEGGRFVPFPPLLRAFFQKGKKIDRWLRTIYRPPPIKTWVPTPSISSWFSSCCVGFVLNRVTVEYFTEELVQESILPELRRFDWFPVRSSNPPHCNHNPQHTLKQ